MWYVYVVQYMVYSVEMILSMFEVLILPFGSSFRGCENVKMNSEKGYGYG